MVNDRSIQKKNISCNHKIKPAGQTHEFRKSAPVVSRISDGYTWQKMFCLENQPL